MSERTLRRGARLGDRFVIGQSERALPFGELFRAEDSRGNLTCSVYVVSEGHADGQEQAMAADMARAAGLVHKNLAQNLGSGFDGEVSFVAGEYFEGRRVDSILRKRSGKGS